MGHNDYFTEDFNSYLLRKTKDGDINFVPSFEEFAAMFNEYEENGSQNCRHWNARHAAQSKDPKEFFEGFSMGASDTP